MTTCFGHRMTILRSTRAIMYMFLLSINDLLSQIEEKLKPNKAIISKADKGNSTVILYNKDYHDKEQVFIDNNNFTVLNKDPTLTFQNQVKATLKDCQITITKDNKTKLTSMYPTAPNI